MSKPWALPLALLALLAACGGAKATPIAPPQPSVTPPTTQLLVTTEWLEQHRADGDLRIVDVRLESTYNEGHIPGAVNLPLPLLNDPDNPIFSMLVPPARMAELIRPLGIGAGDRVVLYDDSRLLPAARVFWALEYYGQERLSVLDGGYPKWVAEGRPVSQERPQAEASTFTPLPQPQRLATKDYILANLKNPDVVLLDVRTEAEYQGRAGRSARGGHIPGAINIDWANAMTADAVPVLRPAQELRAMYEAARVTPAKEVVIYCQTGQRAAHTYFVLRLLGYPRLRLYDGSWEEWGNDPTLPLEK